MPFLGICSQIPHTLLQSFPFILKVMEDAYQILEGHVSKKAEKYSFFVIRFAFPCEGHIGPLKKIWKIHDRTKT